ncbi:MAG: hypothetical protein KatS3mg087_0070 [Patescibacteria group bacterium]|nr:MAG: hypothetical protein KatS3mg087_0070 [Patescibacteria group bacterium]
MRLWKNFLDVLDIRDEDIPTDEEVKKLCDTSIGFLVRFFVDSVLLLAIPILFLVSRVWYLLF